MKRIVFFVLLVSFAFAMEQSTTNYAMRSLCYTARTLLSFIVAFLLVLGGLLFLIHYATKRHMKENKFIQSLRPRLFPWAVLTIGIAIILLILYFVVPIITGFMIGDHEWVAKTCYTAPIYEEWELLPYCGSGYCSTYQNSANWTNCTCLIS